MSATLFDNSVEAACICGIVSKFHCMALFDLEGTLLDANDNFLHLFGYTSGEAIGLNHRQFLTDPDTQDPLYMTLWQSFSDGQGKAGEVLRRTKQGRIIWLQAVYCPKRGASGEVESVLKLAVPTSPKLADEGVNVPTETLPEPSF